MAEFDPRKLTRIDERMAEWVAGGAYERAEWMIGDASGPRHQGKTGAPSLYRIYSMTKPIVSLAALQMIEQGRLHLFHPVARYLPEYADLWVRTPEGPRRPSAEMTILHLLTHTAGLTYGFMTDGGAAALNGLGVHGDPDVSLREDARRIAQVPLEFEPGDRWLYSVATDVLGAVLEEIDGKPLQQVLADRILTPLGMHNTSFAPGVDKAGDLAPIQGGMEGLLDADTTDQTYPIDNPDFARGGHGLFSTLEDYGLLAKTLLTTARGVQSGPIGRATLAHATRNHVADLMPLHLERPPQSISPGMAGQGFGLGFAVAEPGGPQIGAPGAFGWSGAAETWFQVNPAEDLFCVFMAQNFNWPGASMDLQAMAHGALL